MASTYGATRSTDFQSDFQWGRKFLPHLKRIAGELLVSEAPMEEDTRRNTDLLVLKSAQDKRIACRVRRYQYADWYGEQFTIRSGRPGNAKTELAKILDGWGDYFIYGFSSQDETCLSRYRACDLGVFRAWWNSGNRSNLKPKVNADGSSDFIPFKFTDLPSEFVLMAL